MGLKFWFLIDFEQKLKKNAVLLKYSSSLKTQKN